MSASRDSSLVVDNEDHVCEPELAREGEAICWSCGALFIYYGTLTAADLDDVRGELMEFGRDG